MVDSHARLLSDLLEFVRDEQEAGRRKLLDIWARPIAEKLQTGWSQRFVRLERADDPGALWACIDAGDSRFREGDMLVLHAGSPLEDLLGRGLTLESEQEGRWLLRGNRVEGVMQACAGGHCFADPDTIDLTAFHERAIDEISTSQIGREIVLPLLGGQLDITFDDDAMTQGEIAARARGFNARQAEAVGLAFGAEQVACIQGPPGTGKSSVLALVARLMVDRGERVLVTSHTHMAINNALNKIRQEGVPAVKIGQHTQRKGLDDEVPCRASFADWDDRPAEGGYVIGATPFATCTSRLDHCEFDTILFDEASQITVPLALMAMRKGRRFIFVGDQQQLPPVVLSCSVLDKGSMSAFAALTSRQADHAVMLDETYRMNRWLTAWPSRTYYGDRLRAGGANRERGLSLREVPERLASVLSPPDNALVICCTRRVQPHHPFGEDEPAACRARAAVLRLRTQRLQACAAVRACQGVPGRSPCSTPTMPTPPSIAEGDHGPTCRGAHDHADDGAFTAPGVLAAGNPLTAQ